MIAAAVQRHGDWFPAFALIYVPVWTGVLYISTRHTVCGGQITFLRLLMMNVCIKAAHVVYDGAVVACHLSRVLAAMRSAHKRRGYGVRSCRVDCRLFIRASSLICS